MKKMIFIAAALLASAVAATAQTDVAAERYEYAVQVNGRAEQKITPDEIWVAVTLKDNEPKGENVNGLEARMKREFAVLGIDLEKALKVTSMDNAPRRRNQADTHRSYELKVGDARTLASVFEVLGEMGVTEAAVTRLAHSRIEEFRSEVRIAAVKNAREVAAELAGAVDQHIDKAVWIVDNGFYESSPVPMYKATRAVAMDAGFVGTGVEAGAQSLDMQEITLTYNVMAKFVLLPN